jgi:hypothetical protein
MLRRGSWTLSGVADLLVGLRHQGDDRTPVSWRAEEDRVP